ncbi:MAG: hypothetical protein KY455_01200 [Euryarchaeota archaeon]|nr:hypothetical protein [Euryarchaeota archaeon]
MAGSLSASLGAAAAWTIMVLVLSGLGIGLGLAWRTWGSRLAIAERLRSLLKRDDDRQEEDTDETEAAPPAPSRTVEAPEPRRAAATSAPKHRPTPVPPMPERIVGRPASAATTRPDLTPAGEWVEDFRAAGWRLVDDLDEGETDPVEGPIEPRDRAAEQGADAWAEWDDADTAPSGQPETTAAEESGPVVGRSTPPPVDGHPNDAAFDAPDEPAVDPRRGTRVIPIVPPSRLPRPGPDDNEATPWSFEDGTEGPLPAEDHPVDAKSMTRASAQNDNPFAEDRDAPVEDEVDRLLGSGRRLVPVGPAKAAPPSAPEVPEEPAEPSEEEVAKETAALATLPDQHLKPQSVSPLDPDRGRDRPSEKAERRPFETHEDPGAARKGPAVAVPKKRDLSRTEAIEELTAIYGVSYEEACSLLDAGLWGFENHEEWIRAVRASGRPDCVEDATFEKVMSIPMKAIRDDLDKLREKRRATQELERLWGVGADEASALYEAGFTTLEQIREASVDQLARIKEISHSTAFMIKAAAHGLAPDTT